MFPGRTHNKNRGKTDTPNKKTKSMTWTEQKPKNLRSKELELQKELTSIAVVTC